MSHYNKSHNPKPKSYDPVLFRIVDIMKKLLNDERPTMEDLREEYNVSMRTIQNDIYKRLSCFEILKDSHKQLYFNKQQGVQS